VTVEENLQLMVTLDDAWNSQDRDTFNSVQLLTGKMVRLLKRSSSMTL